ncbi:MAG: pyridoxamine 5'-phosphate oxidase family protein [candidate division WOR-3 bacterium]|nr:pyridoxamine 5'-phosphate oxidase family protein [candidate division WOR-3 bacterium]
MKLTDKQKILSIIKQTKSHAYLATCDNGQPIIRSMTPIVEDDLSIWLATFRSSRKIKQIKKNPKVCLAFISQPNGEKTAIVLGKAKIVNDQKVKNRIWQLANYDISQYFKNGPTSAEYCLLKIIIDKIEWWDNWRTGRQVYIPAK